MACRRGPVNFLPLGALIQSFYVGERNIVLGFSSEELYVAHNDPYFGVTVGRVANRIANARIEGLNNKSYELIANDGTNSSHGGPDGWSHRRWREISERPADRSEFDSPADRSHVVRFQLISEDGDQGFPGKVEASVKYTVTSKKTASHSDLTELEIEYEVKLLGGAEETVVNITNHSYFNLSDLPTIEGHEIQLTTNKYLPVDENCIPTGPPISFSDFDVTKPFVLGKDQPIFNHCFISKSAPETIPLDTRSKPLQRQMHAYHPLSKLHLEVSSTEPAFQFYTGDYNDVPSVGGLPARGPRSGFCCEPSRYVNSVNVPEWRGMTLLRKDNIYGSRIVIRSWEGDRQDEHC